MSDELKEKLKWIVTFIFIGMGVFFLVPTVM